MGLPAALLAFTDVFLTPITASMLFGFALRCFGQWTFLQQFHRDLRHFSSHHPPAAPTGNVTASPTEAPPAPPSATPEAEESEEEDGGPYPNLIDMYEKLAIPDPPAPKLELEQELVEEESGHLYEFWDFPEWFKVE